MKVLFLGNNDSGLYKFRKELIFELIKSNEVYFCVPNGRSVEMLISIGCKYIQCNTLEGRGKNPLKDYKLFIFYKRILKSVKPDIVFTYTIKPNIYGGMACARYKVPYVANITGLGTAVEQKSFLQKLCLLLYRFGLRKANKVFFQNNENYEFMKQHKIIKFDCEVIPGSGVNLDQYKLLPYPNDDIVNFVFIARVMKEKGIDQYIDAAMALIEKYKSVRFHVCGYAEGEYKAKLTDLDKKGIIVYHGAVGEMFKIYEMDSCTIHPSYYPEGMSNVLLESAASGRPIITTNRSGCKEVVDAGINGFIVNICDSDDLILKIEEFLKLDWEQRRQMGINGRKKVEKEFDRNIIIQKYLHECERVSCNE